MGVCTYCGEPAGFLRTAHKECRTRNQKGQEDVVSLVVAAVKMPSTRAALLPAVKKIAVDSHIPEDQITALASKGWETAVATSLEDGILTEDEEGSLAAIRDAFGLTPAQLDQNGALTRTIKGAILREVLDGRIPQRMAASGEIPFNLLKAESLVWIFQGVDYFEQKTRSKYVGGSKGVSIRIAKGVYYRVGAFKGERIQSQETVLADTGLLGVTDKNVYFSGATKKFRIPYQKIVTFEPYSDGICIQRDAQTAKPQSFRTQDGWFTYNLITNLAKL